MASYITRDPINIRFILDYIKQNYGDTEYNKVLNYRGSTGSSASFYIDKSLKNLMDYADEHDGQIPINYIVSLVIEYNNGEMTGNFAIFILQIWSATASQSTVRPYSVYHYYNANKVIFNCYASKLSSGWSYTNCGCWKVVAIGHTNSSNSIQYCYPQNGSMSSSATDDAVSFTGALTSSGSGSLPDYAYFRNNVPDTMTIWSTQICWIGIYETSSGGQIPLVVNEKGANYYGTYDLTPAEEQRYIEYKAPLIMKEETRPYPGINSFDLTFNGMTYVAERHQNETGMFVNLTDAIANHSKVIFTNETTGTTFDQVTYTKPIAVPDEVFEKPGLIRADVYGAGASASTIQKQFYFKVKENPPTRTVLSGLTMGTNIKPFYVRGSNRIEFLWTHEGNTNPAIEIKDTDMMVKYMDVWNDSNPSVKYQISPTDSKFPIPISNFDMKGTFHGLLRCGNNKIDAVATEFIWNFE